MPGTAAKPLRSPPDPNLHDEAFRAYLRNSVANVFDYMQEIRENNPNKGKAVVIIGGGWVGAVAALYLQFLGYVVEIHEKEDDICKRASGTYGLRLHRGPHYTHSEITRKGCRDGFEDFYRFFEDFITEHERSVYGLGVQDLTGKESSVDAATFKKICEEGGDYRNLGSAEQFGDLYSCRELDPEREGYANLVNAFDVHEPSVAVGNELRTKLRGLLETAGVKIICNAEVKKIERLDNGKFLINGTSECDQVVNATYYQSLLPSKPLPAGIQKTHQVCMTLRYRQKHATEKPRLSFTVMSGKYPCFMPRADRPPNTKGPYHWQSTLYHAKYTILASCQTPEEANAVLNEVKSGMSPQFLEAYKNAYETDIKRFYPAFDDEYEFVGYDMETASKFIANSEFRSAEVFKADGINYIFSGKVNNVYRSAVELHKLMVAQPAELCNEDGYQYVQGGEFDLSRGELTEKPVDLSRNTAGENVITQFRHLLNPPNTVPPEQTERSDANLPPPLFPAKRRRVTPSRLIEEGYRFPNLAGAQAAAPPANTVPPEQTKRRDANLPPPPSLFPAKRRRVTPSRLIEEGYRFPNLAGTQAAAPVPPITRASPSSIL